jgi:hypothetical protein
MSCIGCGCTDSNACVDPLTGETCAWVDCDTGPLCSFCAESIEGLEEEDEPLVELVSDAEADRFLRARRASA